MAKHDPKSYVGTGVAYPQGEIRADENPYAFQQTGITSSPAFTGYDPTAGAGRGKFAPGTQLKRLDTGETVTSTGNESFNLNYVQLLGQPSTGQTTPNLPPSAQQPSPLTVQPTPYTGGALPLPGIQTALTGLQNTNLANLTPEQRQQLGTGLQGLNQSLQRYRQAFQQGPPAGTDLDSAAAGRSAVQKGLPPAPQVQQPTPVDNLMLQAPQDPFFQEIMTTWRDFMSPTNQRTSLTQEYTNLLKASGLESLDTELMNMKNVIEGTEDDIRNEVTKAGGFSTDSQVLALTGARNKQLIKNYNTLLETRNSKEQYLNTMIGLEAQDRQEADRRFDRMMNFGFQMMDYKNKMVDNTRSTLTTLLNNKEIGARGVYAAYQNDPQQLRYAEQILGLGTGGLQRLATLPPEPLTEEEELGLEYKRGQLDLQKAQLAGQPLEETYKKAQIANIYSEIAEREDDGTITVDTSGKVILKPEEALKINKELVNNDAYKAIRKGQDSLQYLLDFENKFNEYGLQTIPGGKKGKLKSTYQTTILNLKEFFNLGVLNGPDIEVLKGILPDPATGIFKKFRGRSSAVSAGISTMKSNIEKTLDDRYTSLASQYGDYSLQSLNSLSDLQRIYIEQKSKLNPKINQMIQENPDLLPEDIISIISQ